MKVATLVTLLVTFGWLDVPAGDPAEEARRRMMERIGSGVSSSLATPTPPTAQVEVGYVAYLTEEREWTDVKGRRMMGRLVAFSAPKPGETGPVEVIREGKILLRRQGTTASSEVPLDRLSGADQEYVERVSESIEEALAAESTERQTER